MVKSPLELKPEGLFYGIPPGKTLYCIGLHIFSCFNVSLALQFAD
jgi:hypothetical protein